MPGLFALVLLADYFFWLTSIAEAPRLQGIGQSGTRALSVSTTARPATFNLSFAICMRITAPTIPIETSQECSAESGGEWAGAGEHYRPVPALGFKSNLLPTMKAVAEPGPKQINRQYTAKFGKFLIASNRGQ